MQLYQWNIFGKGLVNAAYEVFVAHIGPLYLVPVVIWIAVTFRQGDWDLLLQDSASPRRITRLSQAPRLHKVKNPKDEAAFAEASADTRPGNLCSEV